MNHRTHEVTHLYDAFQQTHSTIFLHTRLLQLQAKRSPSLASAFNSSLSIASHELLDATRHGVSNEASQSSRASKCRGAQPQEGELRRLHLGCSQSGLLLSCCAVLCCAVLYAST